MHNCGLQIHLSSIQSTDCEPKTAALVNNPTSAAG
jgi:hypothetical protein